MSRQQRRAAERQAQKENRPSINKANAQLSTGPKSAEGKATSSRNSFKHGLYSKELCIPGEDPAALDALKADLRSEHQPATETEAILVNEMAEQYWRLLRGRIFETNLYAKGEFVIAHVNAAQRLMASAERGFHKALKTLRELQKARGFVPQIQKLEQPAAAKTLEPVKEKVQAAGSAIPAVSSLPASGQHFVPQNGEQARHINHESAKSDVQIGLKIAA
jgi:hypothetical protein